MFQGCFKDIFIKGVSRYFREILGKVQGGLQDVLRGTAGYFKHVFREVFKRKNGDILVFYQYWGGEYPPTNIFPFFS